MFCPNCGEKIEDVDQKFCSFCGSKINVPQVSSPIESNLPPTSQIISPQSSANYSSSSIAQQEPFFKEGAGVYSKRSLGFSIVSLILGLIGLFMGYFQFLFSIIFSYSAYLYIDLALISWIIAVIFHTLGLIFAIISNISNSSARNIEGENSVQKAGRVIGTLALILNIFLLITSQFYMVVNFILF